ncbi:hypothetical protein SAMN05192558_10771 [Actinokineospora alba]|uniref:Uncharacterized protein n=1 Tax=Actinokineospora alba TaxID=504798 RepID=A0A1H0QQ47_9PSEU|nr:hypothetical protein [Actinokineospora alba]SDI30874.1 hypothetical protein SAMN05421871_10470 [Actinokineospora alba]SDP18859.1 hypothetical protein SAMN05192558_10771 [Actinokineospora alba]
MVVEEQAHRRELTMAAYRDYQNGVRPAGPGAKALLDTFAFVDDETGPARAAQTGHG